MLNAESTQATTRYTVRRANFLPGQILRIMSTIIHHRWGFEQHLSPPPRSEYPILRIEHQGVDFSILEEPIWVEGFWVGVDVWIATNRPDVFYHSGPCRDEVFPVYVVLGGSSWNADGERWVPPEDFLHHGIGVGQIVSV